MSKPTPPLFALQCSIAALVALAIGACGGAGGDTTCVHDTDCASHFCKADGTCAPAGDDGGPLGSDAAAGSDASSGACTPDHDGHITAAELPLIAGRMANFRVTTSTSATIDTAGMTGSGGAHTWDLSGQLTGDADVAVALASPAGAYWAADFPTATYATTLASGSDLLGVFTVSATSVELLGIVSPASGGGTKLTYDPPAKILALPFAAGDTWTSTSTVSGTAQNIITAYSEKYDSRVDDVGTMTTPYGAFPVLRVVTNLTRANIATNVTFAWVAECFGTVATIRSQDYATGTELTSAAEVRRLAP